MKRIELPRIIFRPAFRGYTVAYSNRGYELIVCSIAHHRDVTGTSKLHSPLFTTPAT